MTEWYIGDCKTEQEKIDKIIQCMIEYNEEAKQILSDKSSKHNPDLKMIYDVYEIMIMIFSDHATRLSNKQIDDLIEYFHKTINEFSDFINEYSDYGDLSYDVDEIKCVKEIFNFCLDHLQKLKIENGKK